MLRGRALLRASASYAATFIAGCTGGALGHSYAGRKPVADACVEAKLDSAAKEKFERKIVKLQQAATERVHWPALDKEMLGLQPRLWMEVLDQKHRYATLLYDYWRRWQLSDTRDYFFSWLDNGQGSMIDLPHAPRRLLDEWQVIYLKRHEQPIFRVRIEPETGRFLWEADNEPVTIPANLLQGEESALTARERAVVGLMRPMLEKACRRDEMLEEVRKKAERASCEGEEATAERLAALSAPLVQEGLLCQLRDPFFEERLDAATTPNGHAHFREMPCLPEELLPGLGWEDLLKAIAHDQGRYMKTPFPHGAARAEGKGIFVLDSLGLLYCGTKIRGVFHHSSFVRGHCVKVAGGIRIVDGWLIEMSPHSGHYQPGQEHVDEMISDWKGKGVDFATVRLTPYVKPR